LAIDAVLYPSENGRAVEPDAGGQAEAGQEASSGFFELG
jgi:hypothetical protein